MARLTSVLSELDAPLTGDPKLTFFKQQSPQAGHFGFVFSELPWDSNPTWDSTKTIFVDRTLGHTLFDAMIHMKLPQLPPGCSWKTPIALRLVKSMTLLIGGTTIQTTSSDFLNAYSRLSLDDEGYLEMIGDTSIASPTPYTEVNEGFVSTASFLGADIASFRTHNDWVMLPLSFFFCGRPTHSLPLIALPKNDISIRVQFASAAECIDGLLPDVMIPKFGECTCLATVAALDRPELRQLLLPYDIAIEIPKEFLVDVESGAPGISVELAREISLPVKELFWTFETSSAEKFAYSNPFGRVRIVLNDEHMLVDREAAYFYQVQPHKHHSKGGNGEVGIFCFDAAITDRNYAAPKGTLGLSRLASVRFHALPKEGAVLPSGTLRIFALCINILRFKDGCAGLVYT